MRDATATIAQLKALYGVSDTLIEDVRRVGALMVPDVELVIEDLYVWLRTQPEFTAFFADPSLLLHVKSQQKQYWREFLTAPLDAAYLERRRAVGRTHARIGLPIQIYSATMAFVVSRLMTNAREKFAATHPSYHSALTGIVTLAQLDSGIALDAIFNYHAETFDRIAAGDYSHSPTPPYEGDLFGHAVAHMTSTLQKVENLGERISAGDLDVDVPLRGDKDRLGKALVRMLETLRDITQTAYLVANGTYTTELKPRSAKDKLGLALQLMTKNLRTFAAEREEQLWFANQLGHLNEILRGELSVADIADCVTSFLCNVSGAHMAALYCATKAGLDRAGGYALAADGDYPSHFDWGESLVGQVAKSKSVMYLQDIPNNFPRVRSGLGEAQPIQLALLPLVHGNKVAGVVELAAFTEFSAPVCQLMERSRESIAVALLTAMAREKIESLLSETQRQTAELLNQREELRRVNLDLESQTEALRQSDEELRAQQGELELSNRELEEKTQTLERQKQTLETAAEDIREKSRQLETASRYKSEFLANMSHELRTPLNSLLLLARLLADNTEGNLNQDQLEAAAVIHRSGNDLLILINDILDLSKIEAGKMTVVAETIDPAVLVQDLKNQFNPVAETKGLRLDVEIARSAPRQVISDSSKVTQILSNLLGNALKFTHEGSVCITLRPAESELAQEFALAIDVSDTGIGIPEDKREMIFEAFAQVDGTTSRRYGGTGLGLSICRRLTELLQGQLSLDTELGRGSKFTLYLPARIAGEAVDRPVVTPRVFSSGNFASRKGQLHPLSDPISERHHGQMVVLIVEDDVEFARLLCGLARGLGFRCLVATDGHTGLQAAIDYRPTAILLDIALPEVDGWAVLDRLKAEPDLRHIPVYCISAYGDEKTARHKGAVSFIHKPVDKDVLMGALQDIGTMARRQVRTALWFSGQGAELPPLGEMFHGTDIELRRAGTIEEILQALRQPGVDCLVIALSSNTEQPFKLLTRIAATQGLFIPPIVIYASSPLTEQDQAELTRCRARLTIRRADSRDALADEVTLFLHSVVRSLPESLQSIIRRRHSYQDVLAGKCALLVDDDMRNLFALSSALRKQGMEVMMAEHGAAALKMLGESAPVDIILMDIMMPVMDGYAAIRAIRQESRFAKLPILALTAKALTGDREKCLEAGANDYIAKPVELDRLLSTLRVWLEQEE